MNWLWTDYEKNKSTQFQNCMACLQFGRHCSGIQAGRNDGAEKAG